MTYKTLINRLTFSRYTDIGFHDRFGVFSNYFVK